MNSQEYPWDVLDLSERWRNKSGSQKNKVLLWGTYRSLFIAWGTVWFDPPRLAVEDFMIPPLLSQPPLPKTKQFGSNFCFLTHKRIGWSVTTVFLGRFMKLLFLVNKPDSNSISLNNSKCASQTSWNPQQICYHSSTASEKSFIEKIILQTLCKRGAEIFSGSSRTSKAAPRKTSRSLK